MNREEEMIEPSFAYLLKDGICQLKEKDTLCDVTIKVEGQSFPCHKVVLASISKYFEAMFTSSMKEGKSAEIELKDMEPQVFETILEFIYTGKCKISTENAQAVMYAADMLQIFTLIKLCGKYIARNLTLENCLSAWQFADAIQCRELIQKSMHLSLQSFSKVPFSSVKSLSKNMFIQYISNNGLCTESEDNVAQMALQWIEAEPERKTDAVEVLNHVRFSFISSQYLMSLMDHDIIRNDKCILKLLHQAQLFQSDPTMYFELPYPQASPRDFLRRREHVQLLFLTKNDETILRLTSSLSQPYWNMQHERKIYRYSLTDAAICNSAVNSKIYVTGGKAHPRTLIMVEHSSCWNGSENKLQDMVIERQNHTMVILGECLYVTGGLHVKETVTRLLTMQLGNNVNAIEASVHVYSIRFNKWHPRGKLLTGVMQHASVLFQGKIYTIGGTTDISGSLKGATNKVQIYSPQTGECVLGQEIPSAISMCSATVMEESIFVVGIEEKLDSDSNSDKDDACDSEEQDEGNPVFYQFKPLDGLWIKLTSPASTKYSALCTFQGKIWNIMVGSGVKVYLYNHLNDMWECSTDDSDGPDESEVVNYSVKCMQITYGNVP